MLKSILEALEHGRLVELPDSDKQKALEFLATMLEAVPSVPPGTDIVELILSHEKSSTTSLGMGWACPHARGNCDGDLSCAIGWSPKGIDYGLPGEPSVHMVVMFFVPNNQRNSYLMEVSTLVRVLQNNPRVQGLGEAADLHAIRNIILDITHLAISDEAQNTHARMIQLGAISKAVSSGALHPEGMRFEALMIVAGPSIAPVVLTLNRELAGLADSDPDLLPEITTKGRYQLGNWQIVRKSTANYAGERIVHDCLAVKLTP